MTSRTFDDPVILVVDDNSDFCTLVCAILDSEGLTVKTANSFDLGVGLLHQLSGPVILIVDLNLGGQETGADFLKYAAENSSHPTYSIICSGDSRVEVCNEALSKYADAFLSKPLDEGRLLAQIEAGKRQLGRTLSALEDLLTGLPNYRALRETVDRAVQAVKRNVRVVSAMVLFDVDWFKRINDELGILAGDRVLKSIGQRFLERDPARVICRPGDVFRKGGDEFVIFLPVIDPEGYIAQNRAKRVEEALGELRVIHNGCVITITVSFGIGSVSTEERIPDEMYFDTLFSRADADLKKSKALRKAQDLEQDILKPRDLLRRA